MKEKKNMKKRLDNALRLFFLAVCGVILGLNVYQANASRLVGNRMPMPFGIGSAVVLSGSMEPTFSAGDLILVREADEYEVGDIVVYQDGNSLVVHRIVETDGDTVITRGDANNTADDPIARADIRGAVLCWIPYVGSVVSLVKSPFGTVCILAAAIALVEIPRRREKEKDDEERQKIIDEIRKLKDEQS